MWKDGGREYRATLCGVSRHEISLVVLSSTAWHLAGLPRTELEALALHPEGQCLFFHAEVRSAAWLSTRCPQAELEAFAAAQAEQQLGDGDDGRAYMKDSPELSSPEEGKSSRGGGAVAVVM